MAVGVKWLMGSVAPPHLFRAMAALLLGAALVSCAGLSRRPKDDVVTARQIASQGVEAMRAGNWDQAEQLFEQAVTACDVDERVRSHYAECLWRRSGQGEAIAHMSEAVKLSNRDPALMVRLGEMSLAQGDLHRAGNLASQAIGTGPQLASAFRLEGDVLRREGHWREALASYHRALSLQEDYPEVQMAVAEVYYQHGRYQRSLATLQSLSSSYASGQQPAELLYLEGLACKSLGRYQLAARHLADADKQGLHTPTLLFHLAECRFTTGDTAEARLTVARALELQPQHAGAQQLAARLEAAQQRTASAEPLRQKL